MVASWFDPVRRPKSRTSTPDTAPPTAAAWFDHDRGEMLAGDQQAMLRAIAQLAGKWMRAAGAHPSFHPLITHSDIAGCHRTPAPTDAVQRAFLAAGCDLLDVLSLSDQGLQALHDLGFRPITQHAERQ